MPSIENPWAGHEQTLLTLARDSVRHGVEHGLPMTVAINHYPEQLREPGCCFVTLTQEGRLRGCIGSLSPNRPLVTDVATHAYGAAMRDPRFHPLTDHELSRTHIEISILTPEEPIVCASEGELLDHLEPHRHGLTIQEGPHMATFLPGVWEQLPDKTEFLRQLKRKAGLSDQHWSDTFRAFRYQTISFREAP